MISGVRNERDGEKFGVEGAAEKNALGPIGTAVKATVAVPIGAGDALRALLRVPFATHHSPPSTGQTASVNPAQFLSLSLFLSLVLSQPLHPAQPQPSRPKWYVSLRRSIAPSATPVLTPA